MTDKIRDAAIVALLNEYEKALLDYLSLVQSCSRENFLAIRDSKTKDEDCRSIQSVCTHVYNSGMAYAGYLEQLLGISGQNQEVSININSPQNAAMALKQMLAHTESVLAGNENTDFESLVFSKKITARWGQEYDLEQLLKHAIVHVLRHRRQIERWLLS